MLDASGFAGNDCAPDLDLSSVQVQTFAVGQEITLDLADLGGTLTDLDSSNDPTGDVLRWLADPDTGVDFPTGASLSSDGVLTWTPTAGQVGDHLVTIIGIDGGDPALADAEKFAITIIEENNAPNLAPIADTEATAGEEMVVDVTVTDADSSQTLTFALDADNSPDGATIEKTGDNTARIRWTPAAGDLDGSVNFGVVVTDNGLPPLSDAESFTVTQANRAPQMESITDQNATEGDELVVQVTATDADSGQTLTFDLDGDNSPTGATIVKTSATTATIRWTPSASDVSNQPTEFRVIVTDDGSAPLGDVEAFEVTVAADNDAPEVATAPPATITTATDLIQITFDEEMGSEAFDVANYTLRIVGGANNGQEVTIDSVTTSDNTTVVLNLAADLPEGSYRLTLDDSEIDDEVGNLLTGTVEFNITVDLS